MAIIIGLTNMSHFIWAYCSLFQEAKNVLNHDENYRRLVEIYFVKADDWEKFVGRA
jgi:hypothetical protein